MSATSQSLSIQKNESLSGEASQLPASKSISNRVLIINALAGNTSRLSNLSDANDTRLMTRLVNSSSPLIDVEDAGTTMRFLTAYYSVTNQGKTITGTARMKQRPIGILVDALRTIGAKIDYLENEGYPPLLVNGISDQRSATVRMRGDVSSQFISAMMMIAPYLPQGLTIELEGKIGSKPYIQMTRSLMKSFGVEVSFEGNIVRVSPQVYAPTDFTVESDWSAASYWFAFVALAQNASITLPRLMLDSLQGDRAIVDIMKHLGVQASLENTQLHLGKSEASTELHWDFTDCPDLAQTVAVVCAAKGISGYFKGLESLRIKETDRIAALQQELGRIGATLTEEHSIWKLTPSRQIPRSASFETYHDHRMAMAFAPLATLLPVTIKDPNVVRKSYPNFWNDMRKVGFQIIEEGAN